MKTILIVSIFLFNSTFGFSQLLFGGSEGLKDTSDFWKLRNKIEFQTMFIKLDTNNVGAYFSRASLHYQLGDYKTSIIEQNEILRRFPDYASDAYCNRGMCYCFLKAYTSALNDLLKAKMLDPTDPKNSLNIAFVYTQMEEYRMAILYLDTAIFLKPRYAKAFANRAFAESKLKKNVEAINDYDMALVLQPLYPEVYMGRGTLLLALKKFDEAIADYNNALKILPALANNYEFYMSRGMVYEKKGDLVNAKIDYAEAEKLKNN